ncbi:MAG: heme ABC transporter ATP-binding protein CcmA [Proteobacteria bacterium]|nr:MAG: heme ABC transporter ATP-binding protein CcmA [Pseudomonadota bacterium]
MAHFVCGETGKTVVSNAELLQARDLFCERDDRILFENLSFSVNKGEIIQVKGPNGAGKTTLLRIISGISAAFEGEVYWLGSDINRCRPDFLSNLLYLGHKSAVKLTLNPLENLRILVGMHRAVSDRDIFNALDKVGLAGYEDVPCHSLSAGQQRRVGLARLYLSDELLWILDEAFTAIDRQGVAELESLIAERARSGGAIVLTTHHEFDPGQRQPDGLAPVAFRTLELAGVEHG